jgi:transposase-like protein
VTRIIVGSGYVWLWFTIDPETKSILAISILNERNMFVMTERFISGVVKEYGEHSFSPDVGT